MEFPPQSFPVRQILAVLLMVLAILSLVACNGQPTPSPAAVQEPTTVPPTHTPAATSTSTPRAEGPTSTPTVSESLLEFALCDRLRAQMSTVWGQSPATVHSGDPRVSGQIEEGDYVRFLMSRPTDDGLIRVQVFPHDNRQVGNTDDQVWISWKSLTRFRLDREMFVCN